MLFNSVDKIMEQGLAAKAYRSACLLVASGGSPVLHHAYGKGNLETIYDLASLTKPLATTAAIMQLTANRQISLKTPVRALLPSLEKQPMANVTVSQLLSHSSGLPAWRAYFRNIGLGVRSDTAKRTIQKRIASEKLIYSPGADHVYSDLGFMLLAWIVERVAGERLDRFAARHIYQPLGLKHTFFGSQLRTMPASVNARVAPTSYSRSRGGRIVGQVHDDNCHVMGGVSGHAGLFSTAQEVHHLVSALVASYRGQHSLFSPGTTRHFWNAQPLQASPWALGWTRPPHPHPSCGRHFSEAAIGHLGFTGTSVWVDPRQNLWIILLTNRVYYGTRDNKLRRLRPAIHNAVMKVLRG